MTAALAVLALVCLALLTFLYVQAQQHAKQIKLLMDRNELERNGLLNRIQVPEAAPFLNAELQGDDEPQHLGFDDDEEFQAAMEDARDEEPTWP